jgi:hypothetical protein
VFGSERDTLPKAMRNVIRNCTFNLNVLSAGGHTIRLKDVEDGVFDHCRFLINISAAATDASPTKMFWVKRCTFSDCYWNVVGGCINGCDEAGWFVMRDYTQNNSFVRDTVIMNGPGLVQILASASGSYPNTVMNNSFDSCIFKAPGDGPNGCAMYYQDGCRWDTFKNCVFIGRGAGLGFAAIAGPVLIDHCTLVGFAPWRGTLGLDIGAWSGTLTMRNTILYTAFGSPRQREYAPFFTNITAASGRIVSNNNLFYTKMSRDSSIYCFGVGNSAPGSGKPWNAATGQDGNSVFGSPMFRDTSSVTGFDAHLSSGSLAIGRGVGGADIGAYPFGPGGGDPRPAAISNLTAVTLSDTTVVLVWTATGSDSLSGTASAYDLRMSTQPIDESNFLASQALSGLEPPQPAGSQEVHAVLGLQPSTQYFFAVKARDAGGNWSGLRNVLSITTAASDNVPPGKINDLRTGP